MTLYSNKLRVCLLLVCWIALFQFAGKSLYAQNYIDLVQVQYSASNGNAFNSDADNTNIQEWSADLTLPIVLGERSALVTGLFYENIRFQPYTEGGFVSVRTASLKLGWSQTLANNWSASLFLLPKFSSDLKQTSSQDFQFGTAVLAKWKKQPNLHFKFGAFYNDDLFGPFVTPLFGFYYSEG